MNRIISHELSKFGKISIALHHHSTTFYDLLEQDKIIDYLKTMDHLGFISKSNPGNNHKRFDYVMLQLYILHKLKDGLFRTGLGSNHQIDDNNQASGIVILQIAVLFSNIGHLKGTLSSEVAFLDLLKSNPSYQEVFLREINKDVRWKAFAKNIIDKREYYKVKYLIALNYLVKHCDIELIHKIVQLFF